MSKPKKTGSRSTAVASRVLKNVAARRKSNKLPVPSKGSTGLITRGKRLTRKQHAALINEAWRSSVTGILETGRRLIEAKDDLEHGEWQIMFERKEVAVGLKTAQRLMKISNDERLSKGAHVHLLHQSWGTLYELTKLPDDVFEAKIEDGTINPEMQRKDISGPNRELLAATRAARQIAPAGMPGHSERYQLFHSSVAELAQHIKPNSVDWIITDPPYPEEFLPCYAELAKMASIVLKPGGSCLVMVGQMYFLQVGAALLQHLTYNWTSAYLTPGGQATQVWPRKINNFWKPLLWFTKGECSIEHWTGDVCQSKPNDNDKRFHDWGQSESGMADIVERYTTAGQTIIDPFVGGGTTGVVALQLNRYFIGSDSDADVIATTTARLENSVGDERETAAPAATD
jgi:DNA methylase/Protein of unknown function (DUF3102)